MENYSVEFDEILKSNRSQFKGFTNALQEIEDKCICKKCGEIFLINEFTNHYVCKNCGIVKYLYATEPGCYERKKMYMRNTSCVTKKNIRHKDKRLREKLISLGIQEEKVIEEVKSVFHQFNEFDYFFGDRRNLPRYSYIIQKALEIKGLPKCPNIPLLSKETIRNYDSIWRNFCDTIGIHFMPTRFKKKRSKVRKKLFLSNKSTK